MNNHQKRRGLTLTELAVTMLITSIVVLVIGVVMLDSYRGWLDSYRKVHGGAANDAAVAQVAFEKIVRKASRSKYLLNGLEDLTVYCYQDWLNSDYLDSYARFYRSTDTPADFYLETGTLDEDGEPRDRKTVQLCSTVDDAEFKPTSGGIEMKLVLDDGREKTAVLTTAILHNE